MNILVPVDGFEMSDKALEKAIQFAKLHEGSTIYLVTVVERIGLNLQAVVDYQEAKEESERMLESYAEKVRAQNINCETILDFDEESHHAIVEDGKKYNIDLIVIGRRSISPVKRLVIGSTSSYVISHAKTDVLVINE